MNKTRNDISFLVGCVSENLKHKLRHERKFVKETHGVGKINGHWAKKKKKNEQEMTDF